VLYRRRLFEEARLETAAILLAQAIAGQVLNADDVGNILLSILTIYGQLTVTTNSETSASGSMLVSTVIAGASYGIMLATAIEQLSAFSINISLSWPPTIVALPLFDQIEAERL